MRKLLELKELTSKGDVTAVIARMNVIDHDRDVTLPGFFGSQPTKMVWSHDQREWLGKGQITEQGEEAIFEGRFFLDSKAVADRYAVVKEMGDDGEWSYGFRIKSGGASFGQHEGVDVRFLQPHPETGEATGDVIEVSPVLEGAGIGTGTTGIKALDDMNGIRFVDHLDHALRAVTSAVDRAADIKRLRDAKGKAMADDSLVGIETIEKRLDELQTVVADLRGEAPTNAPESTVVDLKLRAELERFKRLKGTG